MKLPAALCACACVLAAQVSYERIAGVSTEPQSWLTYSGNYAGHRYSPLKARIDRSNVARLKPVWIYQTNDLNQFETTPLVADGVMYISEPPSQAAALDLRTGRPLWQFRRTAPSDVHVCCGQVNRGVALLGGRVFLGTVDAHLLALDARTGHVLWDTTVADYKTGYSITDGSIGAQGQSDCRHFRWGIWYPRLPGRPMTPLRAKAAVALLDRAHHGRAGKRDLGWRHLEDFGSAATWVTRFLRSGAQPDLLGHWQSRTGL